MSARNEILLCLLMIAIGFLPSGWVFKFKRVETDSDYSIGSKSYTENMILAELVKLAGESEGLKIRHQSEIQGTQIIFQYLLNRSIDVYPEYIGTIRYEILQDPNIISVEEIRQELRKKFNLEMTDPIGFENTYSIGMLKSRAMELGISKISDLAKRDNLRMFFEPGISRKGGWLDAVGNEVRYQYPEAKKK